MTTNANWIHKFDQATGALRNIAEILAAFRRSLIEEGFTEEGAADLVGMLLGRRPAGGPRSAQKMSFRATTPEQSLLPSVVTPREGPHRAAVSYKPRSGAHRPRSAGQPRGQLLPPVVGARSDLPRHAERVHRVSLPDRRRAAPGLHVLPQPYDRAYVYGKIGV